MNPNNQKKIYITYMFLVKNSKNLNHVIMISYYNLTTQF